MIVGRINIPLLASTLFAVSRLPASLSLSLSISSPNLALCSHFISPRHPYVCTTWVQPVVHLKLFTMLSASFFPSFAVFLPMFTAFTAFFKISPVVCNRCPPPNFHTHAHTRTHTHSLYLQCSISEALESWGTSPIDSGYESHHTGPRPVISCAPSENGNFFLDSPHERCLEGGHMMQRSALIFNLWSVNQTEAKVIIWRKTSL